MIRPESDTRPVVGGAREKQIIAGGRSAAASTIADTDIEAYLRSLAARADNPPLISDLTAEEIGTPTATASIARAALAWLLDGRQDTVERRLRDELAEADVIFRWRIQAAELDMRTGYEAPTRPSWAELQQRRAEMLGMPVEELGNTDFDPKYAITGEMRFDELHRARQAVHKAQLPPELIQEGINRIGATS